MRVTLPADGTLWTFAGSASLVILIIGYLYLRVMRLERQLEKERDALKSLNTVLVNITKTSTDTFNELTNAVNRVGGYQDKIQTFLLQLLLIVTEIKSGSNKS